MPKLTREGFLKTRDGKELISHQEGICLRVNFQGVNGGGGGPERGKISKGNVEFTYYYQYFLPLSG